MRKLLTPGSTPIGVKLVHILRRHVGLLGLTVVLGLTISGSGSGLGALPPAGAVVSATTFGPTLTLPRPATTISSDVLVASVSARLPSTASITPPTGWSLIRRDSSASGYSALTQALYYKVAGSSEPASYSWSLGSQASAAGAVIDFKDVDPTAPVDSHSGAFTPESGSIVAPSVTTASAGDTIVGFYGISSSKTIRPPTGMTEEFDAGYAGRPWSLDVEGAAYVQATAGATRDMTARTRGRASSALGQLLALRPLLAGRAVDVVRPGVVPDDVLARVAEQAVARHRLGVALRARVGLTVDGRVVERVGARPGVVRDPPR